MKRLVDEALARDGTLNGIDTEAMAHAKHAFRSAARLGVTATARRADNLQKDHNALARRLLDKHDDHLRFTRDPGTCQTCRDIRPRGWFVVRCRSGLGRVAG